MRSCRKAPQRIGRARDEEAMRGLHDGSLQPQHAMGVPVGQAGVQYKLLQRVKDPRMAYAIASRNWRIPLLPAHSLAAQA